MTNTVAALRPTTTVVVPTFNEGGNVRALVEQLNVAFDGELAEVLFVDDSTDETPAVIESVAEWSVLPVRQIRRTGSERVGGLSGAVARGIAEAHGEYVVVMDGDLQHPPAMAPNLRDLAVSEHADVVAASRYLGDGDDATGLASTWRRAVSDSSTRLARSTFPRRVGRTCTDPMTRFFCVRKSVVDLERLRPRGFKILLEILARQDLRVHEVPFTFGDRAAGTSKASWRHGLAFVVQLVALRFALTGRPGRSVRQRHGHQVQAATIDPPSDAEKYAYLRGPQHRWLFWAQALAFLGVAYSLLGLAANSYATAFFLLPLVALTVEQVLALRTSTFARRVTVPDHRFLVETYAPARHPSVDVFLPTAGEPLEILANTYRHVSRLQWPGALEVLVLDDAARPEVEALAAVHGFSYLAREGSSFKKAGNLQHGLDRSGGEHVTILDADFVPRPDYLLELVPYLDDEGVGIVQSPQYFSTSRSMSWLERTAGATQEMFYRFIQPSRDAVGAAICVGTSAVYRRAALVAIGGFPRIGHSEDVYTGVEMGRVGYRTQYVPVLVSRGASPTHLDAFISQQYRWCEGSLSLAVDPRFHREESMSLLQRVSFWSGFFYYATTAMNAILAPLAVLVMVWFFPDRISSANMLPLVGATLFWLVVFPLVAHGRWRFEVLRIQAIYSFAHLFCVLDMVREHVSEWVATGATGGAGSARPLASRVRLTMAIYITATQVLTVVGLALGAARFEVSSYWANIVFAGLTAYVFLPVAWISVQGIRAERAAAAAAGTEIEASTPSELIVLGEVAS